MVEMRVSAHLSEKYPLISGVCVGGVCSPSSRPSVLAVLVVLPGFSKGALGLSWRDSIGVLRPLRPRLDGELLRPHYLGLSDALVARGSGAQETSVNIRIVEAGI